MSIGLECLEEVEQLRRGGEAAVAAFFGRYRARLQRMIAVRMDARILGKVDGDDILQDAFLESARRIHDYLEAPCVPFFVWLRQITRQVLIDTHRRYVDARQRDVRREVSLDGWASSDTTSSGLAAHLADSATSPSQQAARREMIADLRAVLDRLDEIDREILVLRHLEELSNNEVAAILGIDKFAASKRYLRALGRLRTAMLAGAEGREHDGMGAGA